MKNIYGRIMKESECPMVLLIERMERIFNIIMKSIYSSVLRKL